MEKPKKKNYGWHDQNGFDDLESGWMIEGGEDAFLEELEKWKNYVDKDVERDNLD